MIYDGEIKKFIDTIIRSFNDETCNRFRLADGYIQLSKQYKPGTDTINIFIDSEEISIVLEDGGYIRIHIPTKSFDISEDGYINNDCLESILTDIEHNILVKNIRFSNK